MIFMKDISSPEDAAKKAEGLTEMFRHLFEGEKRGIQVTCSIGAAIYPKDGRDFRDLYKSADLALIQAKAQGKNRFYGRREIYL